MEPVQELLEREALRNLKASYFYLLDTKQWDKWLDLFTPDATLQWDGAPSTRGRDGQMVAKHVGIDAIRKHVVEEILDPAHTVHQGHTPLIELTSDTTATGIWAMEDIVNSPKRGTLLHAYGHYHETYKKVDGRWKITSLHLKRLRMTLTTS
jgi:hypothetical protein